MTKIDDRVALRRAFGMYPTGVAVVTAAAGPELIGVTINSFSSVSLDPPLILFSVSHKLMSLAKLANADAWAVNVLGADQIWLSKQFARAGEDKWRGVEIRSGQLGAPILEGGLAVFECEPHARYSGGDHDILLGKVAKFSATADKPPLVFFAGTYGSVIHQNNPPK